MKKIEKEIRQIKTTIEMNKLIKFLQLELTGSALICTLTLSIVHFQPTAGWFLAVVLINVLVGALVWLSYKELKNED